MIRALWESMGRASQTNRHVSREGEKGMEPQRREKEKGPFKVINGAGGRDPTKPIKLVSRCLLSRMRRNEGLLVVCRVCKSESGALCIIRIESGASVERERERGGRGAYLTALGTREADRVPFPPFHAQLITRSK